MPVMGVSTLTDDVLSVFGSDQVLNAAVDEGINGQLSSRSRFIASFGRRACLASSMT